jgi:sugar phosphate isomerase/epimerase
MSSEQFHLSINQMTTRSWSVPALIQASAAQGLRSVGLWREPVAQFGLAATRKCAGDFGVDVSSLCRGGFLTASDPAVRRERLEDNRRAIDEAAEIGVGCLVLVAGGLEPGSRDLAGARTRVAEAVASLAPYAGSRGVRLALEALHPMYCADRSVLSTLDQALDLALQFPADQVGVVVDTFHVWWDPGVLAAIGRAGRRIVLYQVCDIMVPLPADVLLGRAMMGDGPIDFRSLTSAVAAVGYTGAIEVEIFNADIWETDPHHVLETTLKRYRMRVEPYTEPSAACPPTAKGPSPEGFPCPLPN